MAGKCFSYFFLFILMTCLLGNESRAWLKFTNDTGDSIKVRIIAHDTGCKTKVIKLKPHQKDKHVHYHSKFCKYAPINKITIEGPKGKQIVYLKGFGDEGDMNVHIHKGHEVSCGKKHHKAPYTVSGLPGHYYDC